MEFGAKKSLGQHFLRNASVAKKMIEAGDVKKDDTILEIGPGTGALTRVLLETGARVVAVEADKRAFDVLESAFESEIRAKRLILRHADIRKINIASLGLENGSFKAVANIPYYISGLLFRLLLSGTTQPTTIVFLVQKEVAERIARSKKESLLSLSVKVYGDPAYIATVKKGNFVPQPKVDSAILSIRNISRAKIAGLDEKWFFTVLSAGFSSRRKQLVGNLRAIAPINAIKEALRKSEIPEKARAEDIEIEKWLTLSSALEQILHR